MLTVLELAEGHMGFTTGFLLLYVMKSFHNKQFWIERAPCTSDSSAFSPSSFTQPLNGRVRIQICHSSLSCINFFYGITLYHILDPWFSILPTWPLTCHRAHFPLVWVGPNLVAEPAPQVSRGKLSWQAGWGWDVTGSKA